MDKQITDSSQPTFEQVRERLERWRKIKKHREPIPKDIWQDATELAKKHSIYKVSKALSLNYINLKTRVYGTSKQPGNKKTPFIEINQPILMPEMVLELENKKGSRLKISFKGRIDFDPMDFARTFLQKNL